MRHTHEGGKKAHPPSLPRPLIGPSLLVGGRCLQGGRSHRVVSVETELSCREDVKKIAGSGGAEPEQLENTNTHRRTTIRNQQSSITDQSGFASNATKLTLKAVLLMVLLS